MADTRARVHDASICGLAVKAATTRIAQIDSAELAIQSLQLEKGRSSIVKTLYRRTGINARHTVLDGETEEPNSFRNFYSPRSDAQDLGPSTSQRLALYTERATALATEVSCGALAKSGFAESQITHLVTVSCTGFESPGFDLALFKTLRLSQTTRRTHIGFMGCQAALNGLRVAQSLALQGEIVLLVCVELCSLHFSYDDLPEQIVANSLFSDGAAALVIAAKETGAKVEDWESIGESGSYLIPNSSDAMSWSISDHGFRMTLSPNLPSLIERSLSDALTPWLTSQKLKVNDIGGWAIHPGGTRLLESAGRALKLSSAAIKPSRDVLQRHGNMSSPTIIFILDELRRNAMPFPWVMLAFGPGLVVQFALINRA